MIRTRRRMVRFVKAHAYGNDFLLVADEKLPVDVPALARAMCHRHAGVGADGLILFEATDMGTSMRLFNADGSASEISGNGVRCLAALLTYERPGTKEIAIDTGAGMKRLTRLEGKGSRQTFRAAMGKPEDLRVADLNTDDENVRAVVLRVGNPQCVVLGKVTEERLNRLGPLLTRHPYFPAGTNVELAAVEAPDRVRILIWERGVGPTLASGTGACAAAVAAAAYGGAARTVDVIAPGGSQRVEWTDAGLFLTGWAELICEGTWVAHA
jgi:diaminopimelate epimerase